MSEDKKKSKPKQMDQLVTIVVVLFAVWVVFKMFNIFTDENIGQVSTSQGTPPVSKRASVPSPIFPKVGSVYKSRHGTVFSTSKATLEAVDRLMVDGNPSSARTYITVSPSVDLFNGQFDMLVVEKVGGGLTPMYVRVKALSTNEEVWTMPSSLEQSR